MALAVDPITLPEPILNLLADELIKAMEKPER
jgi:hypothetical protein